MSYAVKSNGKTFDILEKSTDVVIHLNLDEKNAKDVCRKLNLGGGFNGWTPEFFSTKYEAIFTDNV